ncbi:unnamed protein product, partial [Polarella glacialis]
MAAPCECRWCDFRGGVVVLDIGSDTVRTGFAGDEAPSLVVPPWAVPSSTSEGGLGRVWRFSGDGSGAAEVDWDPSALEATILMASNHGSPTSSRLPMMLSEPNAQNRNYRE